MRIFNAFCVAESWAFSATALIKYSPSLPGRKDERRRGKVKKGKMCNKESEAKKGGWKGKKKRWEEVGRKCSWLYSSEEILGTYVDTKWLVKGTKDLRGGLGTEKGNHWSIASTLNSLPHLQTSCRTKWIQSILSLFTFLRRMSHSPIISVTLLGSLLKGPQTRVMDKRCERPMPGQSPHWLLGAPSPQWSGGSNRH